MSKKYISAMLCRVVHHDDNLLRRRQYLNNHSGLLVSELCKSYTGIHMLTKFINFIHNDKILFIASDYPIRNQFYTQDYMGDLFRLFENNKYGKIGYIAVNKAPYHNEVHLTSEQFLLLALNEAK